ncbi:CorA family divalent cation transporter [Nocardia amikacinitolerans]|uniref:CorA family divalent cation transporter n=1 Tax=Nocardia amikacinitolerans TaxID=756689 RepID=UPI0020A44530|nr:CorA family divalent cation transporter [Nocardia amikacinitolerans]MCP2288149.1 magnesium transporter [Nocardia amikacinitolerans]
MTSSLGTPTDRFDTEVLGLHWIPLSASDEDTAAVLRERLGIDFARSFERIWEAGDFVYLPVAATYLRGDAVHRETIVFALGGDFVVTSQSAEPFAPFDRAVAEMGRRPILAGSPHGVLYALLRSLNEAAEGVLGRARSGLDGLAREMDGGVREVADLRAAVADLDAAENAVTLVRETQRDLARATRRLLAEHGDRAEELSGAIGHLLADIEDVRQRAVAEHDRARYLQHSLLIRLELRQARTVKILSLSAALLSLALLALCYLVALA